jgi:hypothetical protein
MSPYRTLFVLTGLVLLLAAPLEAANKAPKPLKFLSALVDEAASKGELGKDAHKALRYADRCLVDDGNWERGLKNQVPVNQTYELLGGSVMCWQSAEKKFQKVAGSLLIPAKWVSARARYIEAFRGYLWGIDAKMSGDRTQACRRLREATRQAVLANESSAGLADSFAVDAAKALALAAEKMSGEMGAIIATEFKNQKCE